MKRRNNNFLYMEEQFYKGISLILINRNYSNYKAKRFRINHTNQNVWIPNKHLEENGKIKENENLDYVFLKALNKLELAKVEPNIEFMRKIHKD